GGADEGRAVRVQRDGRLLHLAGGLHGLLPDRLRLVDRAAADPGDRADRCARLGPRAARRGGGGGASQALENPPPAGGAAPGGRGGRIAGGGRAAGLAGRSVLLALGVFFALLPFVWMLRTAFGPSQSALALSSNPIPSSVSFDAFQRAFADGHLGRALLTGIGVSLAILALQLLTAIPAAYVFAWLPFRGRGVVFALVLATLLVPSQVTAIPNYVTISALGLSNSRIGLVLPFTTNAGAIFLLRQYMTTIPVSVLEAARMDGLGLLRTLRTIVVPLSMPAIATVSVFSFLLSFNEYLWPLLEARS